MATGFPVAIGARKQADRWALVPLLAGSLCGLVLGAFLLAILPLSWLRHGLGVLTLIFGISPLHAARRAGDHGAGSAGCGCWRCRSASAAAS